MKIEKNPTRKDYERLAHMYHIQSGVYLEMEMCLRKLLQTMKNEGFHPELWPGLEELILPF